MRAVIADSPVSSLSLVYTGAMLDGLNLKLYPVVQRYSASHALFRSPERHLHPREGAPLPPFRRAGHRRIAIPGWRLRQRGCDSIARTTRAFWVIHSLLLERRTGTPLEATQTGRASGYAPISRGTRFFGVRTRRFFGPCDAALNFKGMLQNTWLGVPEVTMRLGNQRLSRSGSFPK